MRMELKPIGVIRSPYKRAKDVPIQAYRSKEIAEVEVFKEYEDGLKDIEGFSHILILYWLHKSEGYSLYVKPFLDTELRGVFATRHPNRPNPIGLSLVRLLERKNNVLRVQGIDVIDGTPLLDIKPYVPRFNMISRKKGSKSGWLEDKI